MVTRGQASALPPREDPDGSDAFVEETRALFGDEAAEELAQRIRAQRAEEHEQA